MGRLMAAMIDKVRKFKHSSECNTICLKVQFNQCDGKKIAPTFSLLYPPNCQEALMDNFSGASLCHFHHKSIADHQAQSHFRVIFQAEHVIAGCNLLRDLVHQFIISAQFSEQFTDVFP